MVSDSCDPWTSTNSQNQNTGMMPFPSPGDLFSKGLGTQNSHCIYKKIQWTIVHQPSDIIDEMEKCTENTNYQTAQEDIENVNKPIKKIKQFESMFQNSQQRGKFQIPGVYLAISHFMQIFKEKFIPVFLKHFQ